jgi:hypothetical protein
LFGRDSARTACGERYRPYTSAEDGESADGFLWSGRFDFLNKFDYAVVYCHGCGVEEAGHFYETRVAEQRRSTRRDIRDQQAQWDIEHGDDEEIYCTCTERTAECSNTVDSAGEWCSTCTDYVSDREYEEELAREAETRAPEEQESP